MEKYREKDRLSLSDRDLVIAFKQGDRQAYDEIYRRHSPKLRVICARRLGHRHDAEEALQEAFLRAYQALPRFNGQYKLGPWLNRIAINVCIDQLRYRERSAIVTNIEESALEAVGGPDELIASSRPEVLEALAEIKPLHAEALKLQVVHGLSHEEVAGKLRMSPAQVKSLLHRARASFKRVLQGASGWFVAPLAFLRKSRGEQGAVGIGGGLSHTMGLVAALHATLPSAEKVLSGTVVAALAFTTSPAPTNLDARGSERAPVAVSAAPEGAPMTFGAVPVPLPTATLEAGLEVTADLVAEVELPLEDGAVKSAVDDVKRQVEARVSRELQQYHPNDNGSGGIETESVDVEDVIPAETGSVESTVSDLAEEIPSDS